MPWLLRTCLLPQSPTNTSSQHNTLRTTATLMQFMNVSCQRQPLAPLGCHLVHYAEVPYNPSTGAVCTLDTCKMVRPVAPKQRPLTWTSYDGPPSTWAVRSRTAVQGSSGHRLALLFFQGGPSCCVVFDSPVIQHLLLLHHHAGLQGDNIVPIEVRLNMTQLQVKFACTFWDAYLTCCCCFSSVSVLGELPGEQHPEQCCASWRSVCDNGAPAYACCCRCLLWAAGCGLCCAAG
jgi:hypothetical protein